MSNVSNGFSLLQVKLPTILFTIPNYFFKKMSVFGGDSAKFGAGGMTLRTYSKAPQNVKSPVDPKYINFI